MAPPWGWLSSAVGWGYVLCWGASFLPQFVLNYRRKSVTGLSFDFLALNLLGWIAYATFNCAIYFVFECPPARPNPWGSAADPSAPQLLLEPAGVQLLQREQQQTQQRHWQQHDPGPWQQWQQQQQQQQQQWQQWPLRTTDFCQYAVETNDVVFSLHALAMTLATALQCCIYPRGKQRVHGAVAAFVALCVTSSAAYALAVWMGLDFGARWARRYLAWVYWLYFLSFIKMVVTIIKYIPQVVYNHRRKSTLGWSILNIILDATGGCLSLGQQLLTCYWAGSWTPVTANPVKLGLAVTSILMDFIFVIQHYVLYAEKRRPGPCPLSLRRVRALLRALSRAPERLPPEIAEDLLLCLSDHGFDVDVPKVLKYYSDHPEELPECSLDHCLTAYWRVGGAVGIARGFNVACSYADMEAAGLVSPMVSDSGGGRGRGRGRGGGSSGGGNAALLAALGGSGGAGGGAAAWALPGGPRGAWLATPSASPATPASPAAAAREPLLAADYFRQRASPRRRHGGGNDGGGAGPSRLGAPGGGGGADEAGEWDSGAEGGGDGGGSCPGSPLALGPPAYDPGAGGGEGAPDSGRGPASPLSLAMWELPAAWAGGPGGPGGGGGGGGGSGGAPGDGGEQESGG